MKERLRDLLSGVGESFDYLRSDVRNLSRYLAEREELVEGYRAFVPAVEFSTQAARVIRRKLFCENTQGHWAATKQATRVAEHC